jgi:hypothetical protein
MSEQTTAGAVALETSLEYSPKISSNIEDMKKLITVATLIVLAIAIAHADDKRRARRHERHENRNYIIERQQAYQVRGTPTSRLIIGKREIDVYRDGTMFERNHVVGVRQGR